MTSGLQSHDLVIIAARLDGQDRIRHQHCRNAAVRDSKVVGVFSLKCRANLCCCACCCSQAMVDSHKLRTGFLGRDDYNKLVTALAALAEAPIFIDDTPGISLSEMRAKCRRLQQAQGRLDLIIVDYLQLVAGTPTGGGKRYENRTQEVRPSRAA
jgi:replicative DNA helicase